MREYMTTTEAVLDTINDLLAFGMPTSPRGERTLEFRDHVFRVFRPDDSPIVSCDVAHNETMKRYLDREYDLYDRGERRASEFARGAKMWDDIKNPDGTVNSAYGYLIFNDACCGDTRFAPDMLTPWQWARRALMFDPDSRQAFVRVSRAEHQWVGVRDLTCTMHLNFSIRDDHLLLTTVMRSNDVTRGLPYDMPYFCRLQKQMLRELRPTYPSLVLGEYTHFAHSMHLYETEREKAERMVGIWTEQ